MTTDETPPSPADRAAPDAPTRSPRATTPPATTSEGPSTESVDGPIDEATGAASDARTPEQSDYDLAMYLVADLESRLEDAHMSGDKALQAHFRDLHERALGMSHRAWNRLQGTGSSTFERILRDPTTQMDPEGIVLRSVLAYQNAPTGTACACGHCPSCRAASHYGYCTLSPLHDGPCAPRPKQAERSSVNQ